MTIYNSLLVGVAVTVLTVKEVTSFAPHHLVVSSPSTSTSITLHASSSLFEDEEELIPIAEHYIRAKYSAVAASHGHSKCDKDDAREILQAVLPPVTKDELEKEVDNIISSIPGDFDEDVLAEAIVQNSYWESAGDLVVKELIYLDALYSYYSSGTALLNNDDYAELKDNLVWEGSSVPNMTGKEALFATAVAASRRGTPILDDDEYAKIKTFLKSKGSWVTDREADALEKLGINTFMGYLHRSLKTA